MIKPLPAGCKFSFYNPKLPEKIERVTLISNKLINFIEKELNLNIDTQGH